MSFVDGGVYLSLGYILKSGLCVLTELSTFSFSRWCWDALNVSSNKQGRFLLCPLTFPLFLPPMYLLVQLTVDQQSQEGAQVANDEKKSSYVALLSPQFCWQMDGKPQVPSGSSRGQRWDWEGRGTHAPSWKATGQGFVGAHFLPSPLPGYWRKAPQASSETGQTAVRPRSAAPGPIPAAGGSCAPLLIFTRLFCSELRYHCLLLIGARRWREGSEQASFCPFGVGGLGEEDEGAETEK